MAENPMLDQATQLNYPVDGTKIKFQGIADLKDNTVAIESVEPLVAAPQAAVNGADEPVANAVVTGNGQQPDAVAKVGVGEGETPANAAAAADNVLLPKDPLYANVNSELSTTKTELESAINKKDETNGRTNVITAATKFNKILININSEKSNELSGIITKLTGLQDNDAEAIDTEIANITSILEDKTLYTSKGGKTKKRRRRKYRGSAKRRKSGKRV